LSERFAKKWETKRGDAPFTEKIKDVVNPRKSARTAKTETRLRCSTNRTASAET